MSRHKNYLFKLNIYVFLIKTPYTRGKITSILGEIISNEYNQGMFGKYGNSHKSIKNDIGPTEVENKKRYI